MCTVISEKVEKKNDVDVDATNLVRRRHSFAASRTSWPRRASRRSARVACFGCLTGSFHKTCNNYGMYSPPSPRPSRSAKDVPSTFKQAFAQLYLRAVGALELAPARGHRHGRRRLPPRRARRPPACQCDAPHSRRIRSPTKWIQCSSTSEGYPEKEP